MKSVFPHKILIYSNTDPSNIKIRIHGKSFLNLRNLYLSGSNVSMFDGVSSYNPFLSGSDIQKNSYQPFDAIMVESFTILDNKILEFSFSQIPKTSGFIDIIAENEAGYGKLTDSKMSFLSSYEGAKDFQFPWVKGIYVFLFDELILTELNQSILTDDGNIIYLE